jgi:CRISPR/Cas system endoribonuclease Cas6 (RAMP superfamily)
VQFGQLDELAAKIVVVKQDVRALLWKRHSIAREREHPMQGFMGRVVFGGAGLDAFVSILRLAEKTHIGKATSHGLGRMRVEV